MARHEVSPAGTLSGASFELFVKSVVDYAIFMLDPQGYIVSWNPGAERAKGYTAEEIIGRHFSTFYTPEDLARDHPANELRIARREGRYEEQGWRLRKDGSRFWAHVVITAVRDDDGQLIGFGKVTRDLTERKEREERELQLERERVAAETSSAAKTEFLRTMSHELRTPLNAIIGYLDLLDAGVHGPLNAEQHETVSRVRRSSKVLLGLINDVLNISKIEAGKVDYHVDDFEVSRLFNELEVLMAAQYTTAGLELQFSGQDKLVIRADYEKTIQVLLNLLSNSWKFTGSGGAVNVSASLADGFVVIKVRDNGRGIPADMLGTIFERFVQIDRHLTEQSHQGVGLGLAISRELTRGMGGDITVASEYGHGAEFTITLPSADA